MIARLVLVSLLSVAWVAGAQSSVRLNVNGSLLSADDRPVKGVRRLTLSLYGEATGGAALFTETLDVELVNGLFNAELGSSKPLSADVLVSARDGLWVGIQVEDSAELAPRLRVGTVPVAAWAHQAGKAAHADEALQAERANEASHAEEADRATRALRADDATRADSATTSAHAVRADDATRAESADEAAHAELASRALTADKLGDDDASSFRRVAERVPFSELEGVPPDLLPLLGCEEGEVPTFRDGQWGCARPLASKGCQSGSVVTGVSADGALVCTPDKDTNTTYSAGSGLALTGTTFSLQPGCASGQVLKSNGAGGWQCAVDDNSTNFAQAGTSCPAGQVMVGIAANGTPSCSKTLLGDYVNQNCHLYVGWSDNCTGTGCVYPTNWTKVRGNACNGGSCDPTANTTGRSIMNGTGIRIGWVQMGGKVDDNDRFFFAFKCE